MKRSSVRGAEAHRSDLRQHAALPHRQQPLVEAFGLGVGLDAVFQVEGRPMAGAGGVADPGEPDCD